MVMKHIKLFENWVEELKVTEYLDPSWEPSTGEGHNIFGYIKVQHSSAHGYTPSIQLHDVNFKSFSDYTFWLDSYDCIDINQEKCKYFLSDFVGLPSCKEVRLESSSVKTFYGGDFGKELYKITINNNILLQNMKGCPEISVFDAYSTNLLSLYGCNAKKMEWDKSTLCGRYIYNEENLERLYNQPKLYFDIKFHADSYVNFRNINYSYVTRGRFAGSSINPWHNIYYDPDEVDNFSFLFLSFWEESEIFRDKAEEYLGEISLTGVTRSKEELW